MIVMLFHQVDYILNKINVSHFSGRKPLAVGQVSKLGGYNPFLQTSLPDEYR